MSRPSLTGVSVILNELLITLCSFSTANLCAWLSGGLLIWLLNCDTTTKKTRTYKVKVFIMLVGTIIGTVVWTINGFHHLIKIFI
jgi:hypothetical protein